MSRSQDPAEQTAPAALEPMPGAFTLLDGDAAGYCSGGVCHIPASAKPSSSGRSARP